MENEEKFKRILDNNEIVKAIIKPNKKIYILKRFILVAFVGLFISLWLGAFSNVGSMYFNPGQMLLVGAVIYVIILILSSIFINKFYKNNFYCITSSRIIIRGGLWGIDFKTISLVKVEAVDLKVSPLDKMISDNIGTISIANRTRQTENGMPNFSLQNIENVDEIYKLIKYSIEDLKGKN